MVVTVDRGGCTANMVGVVLVLFLNSRRCVSLSRATGKKEMGKKDLSED